MALRPENLPRDPALLAELALALDAENESLRATIASLKGLIFGARSERMAAILAEQLALDLQDLADDVTPSPANDDAPSSPTTNSRGSRPKPKRNIGALPKSLPRCEQIIEPEATICPCCAGKLHRIGEDVSEALDVEPAILRVLRTIRPKYACRACEDVVVQAKAPARLVEGGMVTTALVVHIAVAKYGWQSTLYRQMQILAGYGVQLDRSTLTRWMKQAAWMLKALYLLQLALMHGYPRLFCDETPMPVLDPSRNERRYASSGPMRRTIGLGLDPRRRPSPMCSRKVEARRKSPLSSPSSRACCKWTATPPINHWKKTRGPLEKSVWLFVLLTRVESSSPSIRRRSRPSQGK